MENTIVSIEQLNDTLNTLNIADAVVKTSVLLFSNSNITTCTKNHTQYFKASDISKALDITIAPEVLSTFEHDEVVQMSAYNKKGNAQLTDFLTVAGVYKFMYSTGLHSEDDLSIEHASAFKSWFTNSLNEFAVVNYKKINACVCDTPKPEPVDAVESIVDATRTCRTCKIQQEISHYEVANKKGDYKTNCITCVDLSHFVCKKCNATKLGSCYKFSDNKIRQRTCNECIDAKPDVFKVCKKCSETKPNTLFGRYSSGDLHNECTECYKMIIKRDVKKCRKCKELLPVANYKSLENGKRNRLCNVCRV